MISGEPSVAGDHAVELLKSCSRTGPSVAVDNVVRIDESVQLHRVGVHELQWSRVDELQWGRLGAPATC
ncbi:hypothetical protein AB0I10_32475 [Streptomyces sp. NPDC050636]|uniref:hypothetical protein n=1 Tax=Streptomyces sp. NPDC050636 TaxID=3154510 RepID=UPI0034489513